ncbi:MAG: hypothetical protein CL955_04085 [Erythrobacteraceae bacterium]|nr:hypothetical protein [Erythrobacteraceae bacterium]
MEWMLMPVRRYADFSGRSRRKEFWMFQLGIFLLYIAVLILAAILGAISETLSAIVMIIFAIAMLGLIIPSIAVAVRRMHDQDKSGWMLLLGLIPLIGSIILLVFYCTDGTPGPNQYGPDPKGQADPTAFE